MIIGIEAQRIFRRKKHGMDMVALELIRNLQRIDTTNQYVVFVAPGPDDAIVEETANVRIVQLKGGFYPLWEQFALPRAARRAGCELLHCTSNTAPVRTRLPLMVTLHDIIYMESSIGTILKGSGSLYQKFGNLYRRLVVPRIVAKSRRIITVSKFEQNRIGEWFGMKNDDRLCTVYNGVSEHFKPVENPAVLQEVKEKYHLPDRFCFFLGNTDPKKNTRGTLQAFAGYRRRTGDDLPLVMLDYDKEALAELLREIGEPELMEHIHLTGYVVNTDLPAIYSLSSLFLYTSLRESFGIPMLEAMACGIPVVASNTSSMPEVAGDAAVLADPFRPETITDAMIDLMDNPELRNTCVKKGLERAAAFSWKAMAEQVLNLYLQTGKS